MIDINKLILQFDEKLNGYTFFDEHGFTRIMLAFITGEFQISFMEAVDICESHGGKYKMGYWCFDKMENAEAVYMMFKLMRC